MTQRHGPGATPRAVSVADGADVLFHLAWVNQALQAETDRASAAEREMASFHDDILANIGHELRTPLTIIQGLSEILLDDATGVLPSQYVDFLKQIHQASRKLGQLAETSIMLTKLNSGYLKIHPIPIQLDEAISRVVGQYQEELQAKRLDLSMEIEHHLPLVWADGLCLEIALQALLDNAIKFNVEGGQISWTARSEAERVHLALTDTGVGIPPAKLPALFAVFGQLESGTTRRFGGLGLGLPLVKKLLASMGGDISAHSPGSNLGSTFTLTLPGVHGDIPIPD
ncbi:Signal transduction histidine-protein kinase BarA [compost metagenome]